MKRKDKVKLFNLRKVKLTNSGIIKSYYVKSVHYGTYIDVYTYMQVRTVWKQEREDYSKNDTGQKKAFSVSRARQNVYRIAESNVNLALYKPVFFTLTFAAQYTDLKQCNEKLKPFFKRWKKKHGYALKYIIVPEFHKSGAIHYHGIFFNLPFTPIDEFKKMWSHGYVDLQIPKHTIHNIASYIAKYITKDLLNKRLFNQKVYFTSRGLIRPSELYDEVPIQQLINHGNLELIDSSVGAIYKFDKYKIKQHVPETNIY